MYKRQIHDYSVKPNDVKVVFGYPFEMTDPEQLILKRYQKRRAQQAAAGSPEERFKRMISPDHFGANFLRRVGELEEQLEEGNYCYVAGRHGLVYAVGLGLNAMGQGFTPPVVRVDTESDIQSIPNEVEGTEVLVVLGDLDSLNGNIKDLGHKIKYLALSD